jgi:hypothetical protein
MGPVPQRLTVLGEGLVPSDVLFGGETGPVPCEQNKRGPIVISRDIVCLAVKRVVRVIRSLGPKMVVERHCRVEKD